MKHNTQLCGVRTEELRSDVHTAEGVGSGGWGLFWVFFGDFWRDFLGVAFAKTWESLYEVTNTKHTTIMQDLKLVADSMGKSIFWTQ